MAHQQGTKRQKVREVRDNDYFQGMDRVEYCSSAGPGEVARYRYYSASERVHSKTMEDWLKFSVSLTEFRSYGSNDHGRSTYSRTSDDHTNSLENHKRCIKALFEFCSKLGIKYWTAFDTDLVPISDNWDETRTSWDEVVEFIAELNQRYHMKLLWLAPDLHSHPRYVSGAFTSSDATTFTQAASQIKKCMEMSQRMSAECFLLWPCREGYDSVSHTDVGREIKLFAKLLKMTAEYKDRLNYRCQMLLMPYDCSLGRRGRSGALTHAYIWDVTSCLHLLRTHDLERHYKVCTPPAHHMYMASVYNMLGGVVISCDIDAHDTKTLTLMMKCIIDQGLSPWGGVHLVGGAEARGGARELTAALVRSVDGVAKGLRLAAQLMSEQMFSRQLQQRYSSYHSGFGSRLVTNDVTLEECEDYYKKSPALVESSKSEQLELAFQRSLDAAGRD